MFSPEAPHRHVTCYFPRRESMADQRLSWLGWQMSQSECDEIGPSGDKTWAGASEQGTVWTVSLARVMLTSSSQWTPSCSSWQCWDSTRTAYGPRYGEVRGDEEGWCRLAHQQDRGCWPWCGRTKAQTPSCLQSIPLQWKVISRW